MMADVTHTSVTLSSFIGGEWSNFALGALLVVAGVAVLLMRTGRSGAPRRRRNPDLAAMMVCLGALLTVTSAARLRNWTGAGNDTVHLVGLAIALVMIVFGVRYLIRTQDSPIPALGPNLPWPNSDVPIDPPASPTD